MKNPFIEKNADTSKVFDFSVLLFALLGTVIIHGEIIFNKLSWHDDMTVTFEAWNLPLEHGRWLNQILVSFFENFAGAESLGVINGILAGLFIGIISCLLFYIFNIGNKAIRFALTLIFITIPAVAGNFGYMSGTGANFFGILLCVIALFLVDKAKRSNTSFKKNISLYLASAFLAGAALGQYQCFFTVFLSLLLTYLLKRCIDEDFSVPEFLKNFFGYIFLLFLSLVFYLIVLQIALSLTGRELSSYSGVSSFGIGSVSDYFIRIKFAYRAFIFPSLCGTACMFPFHFTYWYKIFYALIAISIVFYFVIILMRGKIRKAVELLICLLLFPLAVNFNFVLFGSGKDMDFHAIHSLHMYQEILLFLLPYVFLFSDDVKNAIEEGKQIAKKTVNIFAGVLTIIIILIGCLYVRYDNFCYMENEIRQEKAISYFTVLRAKVESVDGYDPAMTVYCINDNNQENSVDTVIANYDNIMTNPFSAPIINSRYWYLYMDQWTGWLPKFGDPVKFVDDERVKAMPVYPNDGSVKVIDGDLVIKFSEGD